MKWNSFNFIDPAIKKTKSLLFPFNLKYWMKLGFVSLLSKRNSFGGGSPKFPNLPKNEGTSQLFNKSSLSPINTGMVAVFTSIIGVLAFAFTFITSVFTFTFIDALLNKNFSIKESWDNNKSKGASFFWFRLIVGFISLAITTIIFFPIISQMFSQGFTNFFSNNDILNILKSLIVPIILFVIFGIIIGIFTFFVNNFSLIDMKLNNINITQAIRNTFKKIKLQKKESAMYLFSVAVLGIALGIISILLIIPAGLAYLIVGGGLFFLMFLISKTLAFIFLVPLIIFFIYILAIVLLPLSVFLRYFSILGYEKLYNKKII